MILQAPNYLYEISIHLKFAGMVSIPLELYTGIAMKDGVGFFSHNGNENN